MLPRGELFALPPPVRSENLRLLAVRWFCGRSQGCHGGNSLLFSRDRRAKDFVGTIRFVRPGDPDFPPACPVVKRPSRTRKRIHELVGKNERHAAGHYESVGQRIVPRNLPRPPREARLLSGSQPGGNLHQTVAQSPAAPPTDPVEDACRQLAAPAAELDEVPPPVNRRPVGPMMGSPGCDGIGQSGMQGSRRGEIALAPDRPHTPGVVPVLRVVQREPHELLERHRPARLPDAFAQRRRRVHIPQLRAASAMLESTAVRLARYGSTFGVSAGARSNARGVVNREKIAALIRERATYLSP